MSVGTLRTHVLARGPWHLVGVALLVAAIATAHVMVSQLPADVASPLVIASHLYALVLLAGLLWLAGALGIGTLSRVGLRAESRLELGVFALALGLGEIAFAVVCLGLAQVLSPAALGAALIALAIVVRRELATILLGLPDGWRAALALRRSIRQRCGVLALLVPVVELVFLLLLLRALVPPYENDVLTYHLQGPNRFLELGGIAPLPDIQQANMPLAINMLYLLGLAFRSDEFGAVLHLALAAILTAATFSLGRRFFDVRVGWIAATALLSTLLVLVFATVAFVDYGLALFDFLAVYAFIVWRESGRRGWLAVSGMLVGCALASKYLGAVTALSLGLWLLALVIRQRSQLGLGGMVKLLLLFGVPAALIAAPWYLKNLLWFGNPLWPFLDGNPNDFNMYVVRFQKFAGTEAVLGPLLLPAYLYRHGSVEFASIRPPIQLLVLPLYIILPKHRVTTALLCLTTVQYLAWSQGAQVLRYLLVALPAASIVAAYVLGQLLASDGRRAFVRHLATGLVMLGLAIPAAISVGVELGEAPFRQLLGLESRQEYLDRKLMSHRHIRYLNENHEPVSRVLMIGDVRSFYLEQPAWVDISLEVLQSVVLAPDAEASQAQLRARGISHVLINTRDLAYYFPIDPERRLPGWLDRFEAGRAGYLEPIATHEESTLYRVLP